MGYCRFKIVVGGLTFAKTSYAKVKASETNVIDFLAGNHIQLDSEQTNLEGQKQVKVTSYPVEELPFIYKTQKFMLWKTRRIIEAAEYLLQVLRLAKKIAVKIQLAEADNEAGKYIDILLEIATDKDDIVSARLCHGAQDAYTKLIQTIPNNFQADTTTAEEQNKSCSSAVFSCILKFLRGLEKEFSYFVISEKFLNNSTEETTFVLPCSLYKRFDFNCGRLTANECFNFAQVNPKKFAEQKREFYSEVETELENLLEMATEIKVHLMQKPDELLLEKTIGKFETTFAGQTCGKLTKIKRLLINLEFRDKLTEYFCEFQPKLIEESENGKNIWNTDKPIKSSDAKDACYFFHVLCKRYFENERIGLTEFSRLANLYPSQLSQRSILSRNTTEFEKTLYSFSPKNRLKYEEILER